LNAASAASGGEPLILDRAEAYIGVMIDDLISRGTEEPYRMFTSRAEYRLTLRADNADQRLTMRGIAFGCVKAERTAAWGLWRNELDAIRALAAESLITPNEAQKHGLKVNLDGVRRSVVDLLAYPHIDIEDIFNIWPEFKSFSGRAVEQLETDALYAGYMDRQVADIEAFRRDEDLKLPENLDYASVGSLSNEVRNKLAASRPATLGAAARISGVTPAALTALLVHVKRGHHLDPNRRSA